MSEQYVIVGHLSAYLGIDNNTFVMRLKRGKVPMTRVSDPETGRPVLAVTPDEAKRIIESEKSKPVIVRPESL